MEKHIASTPTIGESHERMKSGELSSEALVAECLKTIELHDPSVGAFLEVFDDALEQARAADTRRGQGEDTPLLGVPLAVKDSILIEGRLATAGSKILEGYTATYDATAVKKLREAGAVLVGRANLDEFAMGSSTESSAWKKTTNPHDSTRVPGGSSGGSAAAVAMGGVLGALGSDTGGSVRQPASFCGVVGLKPTYGSVSRHGLIAMGSSLDVIGPIARTVADTEILFNTIKGRDRMDATSRDCSINTDQPKTIGVPRAFLEHGVDEDVMRRFEETLKALEEQGHTIETIELPNINYSLASYYIVMPAEVSANLARFDGVRYGLHKSGATGIEDYFETRGAGFGTEAKRRILLGTYVLSSGYYDTYYGRANDVRALITEDFKQAFSAVDVVVMPTAPTPAFQFGAKSDPLSMYLSDIFTVPANLTGMPALSVPMGTVTRDESVLPVGFQCIAPHCAEQRLFAVGKAIEEITYQ